MEAELYKQLRKHCPNGFRINEIIKFGYPFRRLKIKIIANKTPEKSLQHIYSAILRTVNACFSSEKELCQFLGLNPEDFLLKELYYLREKEMLDLVNNKWIVTDTGNEFIKNNDILKVIEEDEFEFLVDARKNIVLEYSERLVSETSEDKRFKPEIDFKIKDENILNGKEENLRDLYKTINKGKSYMIDISRNGILFDKLEYNDFLLVEYIPIDARKNELDPFIEVRKNTSLAPKDKKLTKLLSAEYPAILYQFTYSERDKVVEIEDSKIESFVIPKEIKQEKNKSTLTVWETQQQFEKALKQTKKAILIESPWIKKATLQYIDYIEKLLKDKKDVVILYGIDAKDEHHYRTVENLKELEKRYKNFYLIHLPTHFENIGLNLSVAHTGNL